MSCNLGYGSEHDLLVTEAGGRLEGADPGRVSDHAITRGFDQCGTLGSGNHFLEVQVVDRVFDRGCGRRHGPARRPGLRHDPLRLARAGLPGVRRLPRHLQERTQSTAFELPDRQLACAPVNSPEGQAYIAPCGPPPTSPGATASS